VVSDVEIFFWFVDTFRARTSQVFGFQQSGALDVADGGVSRIFFDGLLIEVPDTDAFIMAEMRMSSVLVWMSAFCQLLKVTMK
jgi:hypothetical protein